MNSSIYSADRTTHLRIVTLALAISIAIAAFAISAHLSAVDPMQGREHADQAHKMATSNQQAMAARRAPHRS